MGIEREAGRGREEGWGGGEWRKGREEIKEEGEEE